MNEKDVAGQVDLNPGLAVEKIDTMIDGAMKLAPNMVIALVVAIGFIIVGILIKTLVMKAAASKNRHNLGEILGGFLKSTIIIFGFLIAATIVVPTLKPGDLIAGLGVGSVAIGFAFKDILQNWLAGLLLLIRQPFQVGDQIEASGYEGTVEKIETRATLIKTYDGQRAVIPNSEIYTNAVLVKTAFTTRRSEYDIGIGYGDNIDDACALILKTLDDLDGIEADPAPEALPWDLAASWVTVRARWWTQSSRKDVVHKKAQVIVAIKRAFDDAKIDMPFETQVHLFHDQTEDRDGQPGVQREGWPAPQDPKVQVKPRYKAKS